MPRRAHTYRYTYSYIQTMFLSSQKIASLEMICTLDLHRGGARVRTAGRRTSLAQQCTAYSATSLVSPTTLTTF